MNDLQDPLPESNFFWRRVYSYLISVVLLAALVLVAYKVDDAASLRVLVFYLSVLLWFALTYYMAAPSAEQIIRIVQTAKMLRGGVQMTHTERHNDAGHLTHMDSRAGMPSATDQYEIDAAPTSRNNV